MPSLDFHFDPLAPPIAWADWSDLGIVLFGIGLSVALCLIVFRAGYGFGHQAGWKEGLKRGREFRRWKEIEAEWENN